MEGGEERSLIGGSEGRQEGERRGSGKEKVEEGEERRWKKGGREGGRGQLKLQYDHCPSGLHCLI